MKCLRFLWLLLRNRYTAVPKEHWITARCLTNEYLWHGQEKDMPRDFVALVSHPSYEAMLNWIERAK